MTSVQTLKARSRDQLSEAPNGGPQHAFPLLEEELCQDPCTTLPGGVKYQFGLQGTQGHVAYRALRDKALLWPISAVLGPGHCGMKYRRLRCTIQALELAWGTFPLCLVLGFFLAVQRDRSQTTRVLPV